MKISRLKRIIRETLEEQSHWWGAGQGYNPPVENGQIIPGDWIYYNNQCEDCSQGQPISYQCYNPNSPTLYSSLTQCQIANGAIQGPQATINVPCVQSDWMYSGACGQQHLGPAPGKANSWNGWINDQWNVFGNKGCYQLGAIMKYSKQQIEPTTECPAIWNGYGGAKTNGCNNLVQVKRKYAKFKWAECLKSGPCANNNEPGCSSEGLSPTI